MDARQILEKALAVLKPGGRLLLEPSDEASMRRQGTQAPGWSAQSDGLFSDRPHLVLEEKFWDEPRKAATNRYYIIDAQSNQVTRCAASYQAYNLDEYLALLEACGFGAVTFYPSLLGPQSEPSDFIVITAEKGI